MLGHILRIFNLIQ